MDATLQIDTTKRHSNLSERCMLAVLNIGVWSASRHDKRVSDEVARQHGAANSNVGNYRKRLLPQDETPLERVKKAASQAREWHYQNTLPWSQDGSRILPKDNYFNYVETMRRFRQQFDQAVSDFLTEYPNLVETAKSLLGDLYSPGDYPNIADIASKFGFDNLFLPFPDSKDFRVDLSESEVKAIKKTLAARSNESVEAAMKEAWNRLYSAVSHAAEKLSSPDAIFRDSLVENLKELVDILPRLNIAEDAFLDDMCSQVRAKLTSQDPSKLRKDADTRAAVAVDAAGILSMMQGYMTSSQEASAATPDSQAASTGDAA